MCAGDLQLRLRMAFHLTLVVFLVWHVHVALSLSWLCLGLQRP